jgi:uncharacterized protein YhaN
MRIDSLSMQNFRRFREANLALAEGINVVKGPNESGKSTMLQALLAVLYWKVDSTRKEVRDCVSWGEKEGFILEIEGESGGEKFSLSKDFTSKKLLLEWGQVKTSDAAEVERCVREWLGLGSEAAFRSTAGIRQDEVAEISAGRKELSESLQVTVTGSEGGKDALQALQSINKDLGDLLRGTRNPAKNPGPLARIQDEITRKEASRERLVRAAEDRAAARRRLQELAAEAEEVKARLDSAENLARDSVERADIEEDIDDFYRRYNSLESAARLIGEDEALEREERVKYGNLKRILENRREEIGELELRRAGIIEGSNIMKRKLQEARKPDHTAWAPYAAAVGLVLFLVGLVGVALSPLMLIVSGAGIALVIAALLPGRYLAFIKQGRGIDNLKDQLKDLENTGNDLATRAEKIIEEAGCDSADDFNRLKMGYLELLARRKEIADKLEVLVPDGNITGVEEQAHKLSTEVSIRERRLRELRGLTVDPGELQGVLREKDSLRSKMEGLKEERIRLEVALSEEGVEEEKLQAEEELQFLYEKGNRLIRKAQALELGRRWLDQATGETLSSAARHMESLMGGYISRITDARYSKVSVDEGNFDLRVWSQEKGDEVEPEALSRGTIDQLYLAARLSLVDIICDHRCPPLLLDDPFVTFDPRRLRQAMEVLKDFSRGQQVIIFTCSDLYDRYADRVLDLQAG